MEVPGKSRNRDLEEVNAVLCQPCQERNLSARSNGFCTQCQEHMCVPCFDTHKQFKLNRGHSLADGNNASLTVDQIEDLQKCDQHYNELVKFYCPAHEQVGCGDCMILEHKVCKVEYIRDKARELTDSLEFKGLINGAEKCLSLSKETTTSIKNNEVQVTDINEKFINDVEMFTESLISQINKLKTSLIKQANMVKSKDLETMEKLERQNEVLMSDISSLIEQLKSQTDQPNKLFVSYVTLKPRLKQLQETHLKIEKQNSFKNYQFDRNCSMEQAMRKATELGSLQEIEETDVEVALISPSLLMPTGNQPLCPYQLECRNVKVDGEYLSYVDNGKGDVGLFVFKNTRRFEIEIIDKGLHGTIAVGFVPIAYPENKQPGWLPGSIGYHADDGYLYNGRGYGKMYGPKCGDGDRMGIHLKSSESGKYVVFSRNGREVGNHVLYFCRGECLAIGFHSPGEVVKVLMGSLSA